MLSRGLYGHCPSTRPTPTGTRHRQNVQHAYPPVCEVWSPESRASPPRTPPTRPFCKQMRAKPASGPNAFPTWSAPRRPTPCLACPGDDLTWYRPGSAGARQAGAGTPARSPFGQPVQLQWEHHTKHVHPHRASNSRHTGTVRLDHPVYYNRPVLPGSTHFRSRGAPLPCTRKLTPHPPPQPFCTTILVSFTVAGGRVCHCHLTQADLCTATAPEPAS